MGVILVERNSGFESDLEGKTGHKGQLRTGLVLLAESTYAVV